MYNWQSALLTGTLSEVPESDHDALEETLSDAWRPSLIETATLSGDVAVFELFDRGANGHQTSGPAARSPARHRVAAVEMTNQASRISPSTSALGVSRPLAVTQGVRD